MYILLENRANVNLMEQRRQQRKRYHVSHAANYNETKTVQTMSIRGLVPLHKRRREQNQWTVL